MTLQDTSGIEYPRTSKSTPTLAPVVPSGPPCAEHPGLPGLCLPWSQSSQQCVSWVEHYRTLNTHCRSLYPRKIHHYPWLPPALAPARLWECPFTDLPRIPWLEPTSAWTHFSFSCALRTYPGWRTLGLPPPPACTYFSSGFPIKVAQHKVAQTLIPCQLLF